MAKKEEGVLRLTIPYLDGVNSIVAENIAKKQELSHAENMRSIDIGSVEKRKGMVKFGEQGGGGTFYTSENFGLIYFKNTGPTKHLYRIDRIGATTNMYVLNASDVWTQLTGLGSSVQPYLYDWCISEGNLFVVNEGNMLYIKEDGSTVVDNNDASGHLYVPKITARRINYFKNKLYLGDFDYDDGVNPVVRYRNTILRSSLPVGIISLANGDPKAPYATPYTFDVTDTNYVYTVAGSDPNYGGNAIEFRRGNALVAYGRVSAKTESTLTLDQLTFQGTFTSLLSADEIWVRGTFSGEKQFRWVDNPVTGINVKEYDTFKLPAGDNEDMNLLTNVGDFLMIATDNNVAVWDDYSLRSYDMGIGCSSKNGYIRAYGLLYFINHGGVYTTGGDSPKLISSKVEKYIKGATTLSKSNSVAAKKEKSVLFTLGDVTLYKPDGSIDKVLEDVIIEYNIVQENWYVHTGIKAVDFATLIDSDNSDILVGVINDGTDLINTKEFLAESSDTDDGTEIPFRIDTNPLPLSSPPEILSYPQEIIVESQRGSGVKCFVSLDGEPFYELDGEILKGITILKVHSKDLTNESPPACRKLKISLRDNSKQLCRVLGISVAYSKTMQRMDYQNPLEVG